ncbi:hypothetical protein AN219_22365 [Streptomyces nanshensis]|nr:hypothetical protein AN219_22365 [Streptomyces nanshensis]
MEHAEPPAATREVTSEAELRELLGDRAPRAPRKVRSTLHPLDREWPAHSPLSLIAASVGAGGAPGAGESVQGAGTPGRPAGVTGEHYGPAYAEKLCQW